MMEKNETFVLQVAESIMAAYYATLLLSDPKEVEKAKADIASIPTEGHAVSEAMAGILIATTQLISTLMDEQISATDVAAGMMEMAEMMDSKGE